MCYKRRSNQMRHVFRTQRIDIDWLCERIRDDPGVYVKYVRSPYQGELHYVTVEGFV